MLFRWLTERRREKLLEKPFAEEWKAFLADNVAAYKLLDADEQEAIRKEVDEEVKAAVRKAAADPAPEPAELYRNVYGDHDTVAQFARMDQAGPFGERKETREWRR